MVMGDTETTPFDIGTVGSFTTPQVMPQLRRAAAVARAIVIDLAAQRWSVPAGEITIGNGVVQHARSNRSAGFGELTRGERLVRQIPAERSDQAGHAVDRRRQGGPKVDNEEIVTGRQKYVSDMTRPGMLYGRIVRPSAMGATLASMDDGAARRMHERHGRPRRQFHRRGCGQAVDRRAGGRSHPRPVDAAAGTALVDDDLRLPQGARRQACRPARSRSNRR